VPAVDRHLGVGDALTAGAGLLEPGLSHLPGVVDRLLLPAEWFVPAQMNSHGSSAAS